MAIGMTCFAAILNILPFDRIKMEQNQNDNTSNVAMGSTFRCHIHSCYHCFKVQDGVRDDCQMSVSNLEDTFIIM